MKLRSHRTHTRRCLVDTIGVRVQDQADKIRHVVAVWTPIVRAYIYNMNNMNDVRP